MGTHSADREGRCLDPGGRRGLLFTSEAFSGVGYSGDGGRTWPEREEIETWDHYYHMFTEGEFLNLPDGRVLALSRMEYLHPISGTQPPWPPDSLPNDHAAGHMVIFESTDGGRHWSGPRDFLNYSEVQGLVTVYALEPYHLEPAESGTTVFQCVRWAL